MSLLIRMAWRGVWAHKRRSLLTSLTMISGYVVLAFSLGLTEGGYDRIISVFTDLTTGHLQVLRKDFKDQQTLYRTISNPQKILNKLESIAEVKAASTRIEAAGLAFFGGQTVGVRLHGIDPKKEQSVSSLHQRIEQGSWYHQKGQYQSLIGQKIQKRLNIKVGESFALISQAADGSMSTEMFELIGVLRTNALDDFSVYTDVHSANEFLNLKGKVHRIVLKIDSFKNSHATKNLLMQKMPLSSQIGIYEWSEIEEDFVKAMEADKSGNIILYVIIGTVVSLSVLNTVLMSLLERRREFGIMKALGTKPHQIVTMILVEVFILSSFSCIIAGVLAFMVNSYFSRFGIAFPEPIEFGGIFIDQMISTTRFSVIAAPSILIYSCAMIASFIPAILAARQKPSEAMRTR